MVAEDKKRIMVSLTETQIQKLEAVAKETGLSKSAIMALALSDWFLKREK